jgi:hypothetical protein
MRRCNKKEENNKNPKLISCWRKWMRDLKDHTRSNTVSVVLNKSTVFRERGTWWWRREMLVLQELSSSWSGNFYFFFLNVLPVHCISWLLKIVDHFFRESEKDSTSIFAFVLVLLLLAMQQYLWRLFRQDLLFFFILFSSHRKPLTVTLSKHLSSIA